MKEHNPDNPILHESINGTPTVTPSAKPKKRDHDTMIGFQGDSSASRSFPIPKPVLERDFQMSVQLNPKISVGPGIWGQRNWVGYISGHWNGRWGKGTVVVSLVSCSSRSNADSLLHCSPADKTNNSSHLTSLPTSTLATSFKPMTTLLHTSRSEMKDGVLGLGTPWRSWMTRPRQTKSTLRPILSDSTSIWRLVTQGTCT